MPRCAIGWIVLPSVLPGVGFLTSHQGRQPTSVVGSASAYFQSAASA